MTKRTVCGVALATALALALGGAVEASGPAVDPKVQKQIIKPVYNLSMAKIEFKGGGQTWNLPLNASEGAPVTKAGSYEVKVEVANSGPQAHPDGDRHCEIKVSGGKQVGTYGVSYTKTLTTKVPAIPANQKKHCTATFPDVKDAGKYFVNAKLVD